MIQSLNDTQLIIKENRVENGKESTQVHFHYWSGNSNASPISWTTVCVLSHIAKKGKPVVWTVYEGGISEMLMQMQDSMKEFYYQVKCKFICLKNNAIKSI